MRAVAVFLLSAGLVIAAVSCADDAEPGPGWAIVKVEISEGPALASICIDTVCQGFDPAAEVRSAEFSAYVDPDTVFEVLRTGEVDGEGASGGSPVGGCMLVELSSTSGSFTGGCNATVDG